MFSTSLHMILKETHGNIMCGINEMVIAASTYLGIRSTCHKFWIKGHMQNKGDSANSLIQRKIKHILKIGPIYS
ncbi:hypothetical protein PR048_005489 [Dryococelus australis]|uniref:Uncharacterized protein n=1 Tax=Dryococelus australis TaxID=614101 RepID=A0ABQ9I8E1_9NEOP|nr:hypothetical protein PR048_005489 [Dryococelus australis]